MIIMSKASPDMKAGFLMLHRREFTAQIFQGSA